LVTIYLGQKNVVDVVFEYDENFLLPLLMDRNKLILGNVEEVENFQSQINLKNMFHITMTSV
jgi:hypothetical protein